MTFTQYLAAVNSLFVVGSVIKDKYYNIQSPYGRYTNAREVNKDSKFEWRADQPIEARLAWLLMEVPNLVIGTLVMFTAYLTNAGSRASWLIVSLFMFHYLIRTLVYSALIKGGKPMPLEILCYGSAFTLINGFVQTYHHLFEVNYSKTEGMFVYLQYIRILWGVSIFIIGFGMNQYCDAVLRNLRKNDEDKGYYIPHGYFFEYLSAPNLVGEIIEWLGYAIAANTFVSFAFSISTAFVIGARAIQHHEWYLKKFAEEYPIDRKCLIPFYY